MRFKIVTEKCFLLRVHTDGEDTESIVIDLAKKVSIDTKKEDIACHCLPARRNQGGPHGGRGDIVVKFVRSTKTTIMKRNKPKTNQRKERYVS